ncbi:MAG: Nif3-like dinuclear metal center hexameric protein [Bacilli bacterium]|nr:Nif3-like dinuclear metal center hexameric protein [Bacilli bacterium]
MVINEIITYMENKYPRELASDFDIARIGLIIGDGNLPLNNILLALDLTPDTLDEAISKNANLIITHHPFIFNPIFKIPFSTPQGTIIKKMCAHNISLYVAHTNLDVAKGGVNDTLAEILGLVNVKIINNEVSKDNFLRYGEIPSMLFAEFVSFVRKRLNVSALKMVGNAKKTIKRVGIVGGAGATSEAIERAIALGLDCYITGEIKLHIAQSANNYGLALIEVGHGIEKLVLPRLKTEMENELKLNRRIFVSAAPADPLLYNY